MGIIYLLVVFPSTIQNSSVAWLIENIGGSEGHTAFHLVLLILPSQPVLHITLLQIYGEIS